MLFFAASKRDQRGDIQVWTRPLLPEGTFGFAFLSTGDETPQRFSIKLSALNFLNPKGYKISEVFSGREIGYFEPDDPFTVDVNPSGVFFGKAVPK